MPVKKITKKFNYSKKDLIELVLKIDDYKNFLPWCINSKILTIDKNKNRAVFSNFGDFSTISAPGTHIYSAKPDGKYEYLDGTSMASPIVAGAVILIKSIKPEISNKEIIKILRRTGKNKNIRIGPVLQLYPLLNSLKN